MCPLMVTLASQRDEPSCTLVCTPVWGLPRLAWASWPRPADDVLSAGRWQSLPQAAGPNGAARHQSRGHYLPHGLQQSFGDWKGAMALCRAARMTPKYDATRHLAGRGLARQPALAPGRGVGLLTSSECCSHAPSLFRWR